MKLKVAHTPDADDAFMFYAMVSRKIPLSFDVEHIIMDIEALNELAFKGGIDVTALSVHAYAYLSDRYRILSAGASVGDGYGPIVVANEDTDLEGRKIAIPGKYTTSYLYLKLALSEFKPVEMRFDEIIDAVKKGVVDAGLLIHEGQITYEKHGLVKVLDLWEWWKEETNLPMPLGVNVISRSVDEKVQREFLNAMKQSIKFALENPEEATEYAMKFSRGMSFEETMKFAKMYVNEYTYEMPDSVLEAMNVLFEMGEERGFFKKPILDVLF